MAVVNLHVGDTGVRLLATVTDGGGSAIALVGPITFRLKKPNGVIADVSGSLVGDGSTGQADYITREDDLPVPGNYKVQLKDADGPWRTDILTFRVDPNL